MTCTLHRSLHLVNLFPFSIYIYYSSAVHYFKKRNKKHSSCSCRTQIPKDPKCFDTQTQSVGWTVHFLNLLGPKQHRGATQNNYTHANQLLTPAETHRINNRLNVHIFGLWTSSWSPVGKPSRHWTPHGKSLRADSKQEASCWELQVMHILFIWSALLMDYLMIKKTNVFSKIING